MSQQQTMKAVVWKGTNKIQVEEVPFPTFQVELVGGEQKHCSHGVIVKTIATNICGSDIHLKHGRVPMPSTQILGHELTGEVIEVGPHVEFIKKGDIISVPFNISCGKCENCKNGYFSSCLNANPAGTSAIYGYGSLTGSWPGTQSEYALVPWADFNCLKIEGSYDKIFEKMKDLALLSDVGPTAMHGVCQANVKPGSTVYIAGAGPIGCAAACIASQLHGAVPIVGDIHKERLDRLKNLGCLTVDLSLSVSLSDQIKSLLGEPFVDCAIDCVGFEAKGEGKSSFNVEQTNQIICDCIKIVRPCGTISFPGVYPTADPKNSTLETKVGYWKFPFGEAWSKGLHLEGLGQTPVSKYNRNLMKAIMFDKVDLARWVNATVVDLEEAPDVYKRFEKGESVKFILDPHHMLRRRTADIIQ